MQNIKSEMNPQFCAPCVECPYTPETVTHAVSLPKWCHPVF